MPGLALPQSLLLPAADDVDGRCSMSSHLLCASAQSLPRFKSPPPCAARRQAPCSPSPYRRAKPLCVQTARRRRQASRVKYHPESLPLHAFDKLPWIASLDVPPSDLAHPADIADLSTLPQSGPDSLHRRKPSLRSSPFSTPQPRSTHDDFCPWSARQLPSRPSTPAPRFNFDPTRVTFRHLMPVPGPYSDDDDV